MYSYRYIYKYSGVREVEDAYWFAWKVTPDGFQRGTGHRSRLYPMRNQESRPTSQRKLRPT